jgi:DNA-binding MarR family transcriptional regulator
VSKNTISALLRGLEEQGLIQRTLDPQDRRLFRIRLSDYGRQVVQKEAPQRIRYLNKLASGISPEEQELLINLLAKLYRSISANCGQQKDNPFTALFVEKEQPR